MVCPGVAKARGTHPSIVSICNYAPQVLSTKKLKLRQFLDTMRVFEILCFTCKYSSKVYVWFLVEDRVLRLSPSGTTPSDSPGALYDCSCLNDNGTFCGDTKVVSAGCTFVAGITGAGFDIKDRLNMRVFTTVGVTVGDAGRSGDSA